MKPAALLPICALAASCWIGHTYPDLPEQQTLPTGETQRTYYAGEQVVRSETRVLVWPDGRVEKHGVDREYWPDGSIKAERHFEHGKQAGVWTDFYRNGVPRSEIDFGDGGTPAPMRFWHENGQVSAAGQGIRGVKEGEWTFYYDDGAVRQEGTYAGASRDGLWRFFDRGGQVREEGRYEHGERVGQWKFWKADGSPANNATRTSKDAEE